jgi:Na+/melibiose symporter-like transporter
MAGLFAGVEKTSFALSPLVTGVLLSSAGFASFTGPKIGQTEEALDAVRLAAGALPAAAVFVALAIAALYRRKA